MKITRIMVTCGLSAWMGLGGSSVMAAETPWYLGGSIGASRADINAGRIRSELTNAGFAVGALATDESHTGGKLFAGYRFHPSFALEGGYADLGRFTYSATTTAPAGILSGKMRRQGANLDMVGYLPVANRLSAIGRVGLVYISVRDSLAGTGGVAVANPNAGNDDVSAKVGLGLQYELTRDIGLRGEIERYQIKDSAGNVGGVDMYTAGLVVRF
ncbi:MAG: outer membrane beta-barrel protein [Burkholderiales bacterium]